MFAQTAAKFTSMAYDCFLEIGVFGQAFLKDFQEEDHTLEKFWVRFI